MLAFWPKKNMVIGGGTSLRDAMYGAFAPVEWPILP
jgi:hypothetical protein